MAGGIRDARKRPNLASGDLSTPPRGEIWITDDTRCTETRARYPSISASSTGISHLPALLTLDTAEPAGFGIEKLVRRLFHRARNKLVEVTMHLLHLDVNDAAELPLAILSHASSYGLPTARFATPIHTDRSHSLPKYTKKPYVTHVTLFHLRDRFSQYATT